MKILFFVNALHSGGKERRLVELLKGLKDTDHKVLLVVMNETIHYRAVYDLNIPIHFIIRKNKKSLHPFRDFYRLCRIERPDIVQSWSSMCTIYALPTVKLLGIKLIISQIASAPGYVKPFSPRWWSNNTTFPFAHVIIANSQAGLADFHPPRDRSYCIHNGFELKRAENLPDPELIKAKFGIRTKHVIAMVASFESYKDHHTYFEAAKQVLSNRQDVTFLAVGTGSTLEHYRSTIDKKYQERIILTGRQSHVEEIMNTCTLGVLATYSEGISNAIMEFMALGKPVLATDGGGTNELIIDGVTGYLLPLRDPGRLSSLILELLDDPKKCSVLGQAAQKRVHDEFSLERMKADYMEIYKKLLAETGRN